MCELHVINNLWIYLSNSGDLRLFGKPESFTKRRMGVAVANGADIAEARERAKLAASKVRPRKG